MPQLALAVVLILTLQVVLSLVLKQFIPRNSLFGHDIASVLHYALLTPVFIALVCGARGADAAGVLAVVIFAVIAASDVWDGRVARRWGSESTGGRVFDHFADIGFIVSALSAYAKS